MADGRFTFVIEDCAILQADGWEGNLPTFEASLTEQLACNLPAGVGAAVLCFSCRGTRSTAMAAVA